MVACDNVIYRQSVSTGRLGFRGIECFILSRALLDGVFSPITNHLGRDADSDRKIGDRFGDDGACSDYAMLANAGGDQCSFADPSTRSDRDVLEISRLFADRDVESFRVADCHS